MSITSTGSFGPLYWRRSSSATAAERHQKIVDLLVKAGADVNLADGKGVTPLQHARAYSHDAVERILAVAGAH